MAYDLVQSRGAQFAIDWSVVRRLVRSYYLAQYQWNYAGEVRLSESHWYNPLSWSLPDVANIEIDWDSVLRKTEATTDDELEDMKNRTRTDAPGVARDVEWMIGEAARQKESFLTWMGDVQTDNMKRINQAVEDYQSHIEVAKWVRDTSADGLMVGASVMTGGAAIAVMGGGSTLKGVAKFQDTGSVGAAVMEGAGSFVFAFVKLGKSFSFKQDMVLALVQAPYKFGTELVGGASVGKALVSGGLKLSAPAVNQLFKLSPAKTLFDRVAVPFTIWRKVIDQPGHQQWVDDSAEIIRRFAKEVVQKRGIEGAGKNAIVRTTSSSGPSADTATSARPSQQGTLIEQATLTSKYLLYLAFVNMNEGIGRGW